MQKRELLSIPNIMSYFRIFLIPVYLIVYFHAESAGGYRMAAGILILSALTDMVDGKIARKFNMVTEWGKLLDPVADKLTQGAVALSLTFRFPLMRYLLVLFLTKELLMAVMGLYMLRHGKKMNGAQWHGKVSTTVLFVVMILHVFWVDISYFLSGILTILCMIFILFSLACYIKMYIGMARSIYRVS